jgi:glycosyltransferase involved in cell wall biosynthesis
MKLRVCHIIPTLVQGGAEKQLALLVNHLPRDKFESHVVVLTHSGPVEQQLRQAGIAVHVVGKRWKADPTAYFRLKKKLAEVAPDIVHTWLFAANSYGRFAASQLKIPVILAGERCVDPWKTWWHALVDNWLLSRTSCIATNTSAIEQFYGSRGVPSQIFRVIPNAILPAGPSISKAELFQRLKIPPRKFVVGAIGRLWPQKGYPELIWSSELLRVALKDVWIIIVGDGPQREKLQELRDHYYSQDACKFVGHRADAHELLSAFDLLWNGSLYEGQSNTILEAMAAGVPVIATDIPGNRDLVKHGETGYLYPQGDVGQLARHSYHLLSNPQELQEFSSQSRQRASQDFSLQAMVDSYSRLYDELFARSQASKSGLLRFEFNN